MIHLSYAGMFTQSKYGIILPILLHVVTHVNIIIIIIITIIII